MNDYQRSIISKNILRGQAKNKMNLHISSSKKYVGETNDEFTNDIQLLNINMNSHEVGLKYISYPYFKKNHFNIKLFGINIDSLNSYGYEIKYKSIRNALDNYSLDKFIKDAFEPVNTHYSAMLDMFEKYKDTEIIESLKYCYAIKWYTNVIINKKETKQELKQLITDKKYIILYENIIRAIRLYIERYIKKEYLGKLEFKIYYDLNYSDCKQALRDLFEVTSKDETFLVKRFNDNVTNIEIELFNKNWKIDVMNKNYFEKNIEIKLFFYRPIINHHFNIVCSLINNPDAHKSNQIIKTFRANKNFELICDKPTYYKFNSSLINNLKIQVLDSNYEKVVIDEEIIIDLDIKQKC